MHFDGILPEKGDWVGVDFRISFYKVFGNFPVNFDVADGRFEFFVVKDSDEIVIFSVAKAHHNSGFYVLILYRLKAVGRDGPGKDQSRVRGYERYNFAVYIGRRGSVKVGADLAPKLFLRGGIPPAG